jgi:ubiquinone/menaquinone biosynthesis C-methylase UbiE
VLTVRYERLGVGPGDRLLDLGSGGGRHAFEAMRCGAVVTALDADAGEVKDAWWVMKGLATEDPGRADVATGSGTAVVGDALRLPFSGSSFERVIAAEVLEHIGDDRGALSELARVLRPGGTMAVTVPRWWPELVTWAISDDYHNKPGGHIRIYRRSALVARMRESGLTPYFSHHAHALHSPYWWLRAAVGVDNDQHPAVRSYHRVLVWDITAGTPFTRVPEALLNPVLGKSVVVYARKAA